MESSPATPIKVIGIGNDFRGDDAAGLIVLRDLAAKFKSRPVTCLEHHGDGASLMEMWQPGEQVIIIDAVRSGQEPGHITRLDALHESIPADFFHYSTHAFGLAEAVELSRKLESLPEALLIFGVEGSQFDQGASLSPEVAQVLPKVVQQIGEVVAVGLK